MDIRVIFITQRTIFLMSIEWMILSYFILTVLVLGPVLVDQFHYQ